MNTIKINAHDIVYSIQDVSPSLDALASAVNPPVDETGPAYTFGDMLPDAAMNGAALWALAYVLEGAATGSDGAEVQADLDVMGEGLRDRLLNRLMTFYGTAGRGGRSVQNPAQAWRVIADLAENRRADKDQFWAGALSRLDFAAHALGLVCEENH
jgi:hypothetical protein